MTDMEARRECMKHNVAQEEERRAKAGSNNKHTSTGKVEGPDVLSNNFLLLQKSVTEIVEEPILETSICKALLKVIGNIFLIFKV
ncbi:hypothetical protein ACET3Z_013290 [Daucus carota]